MTYLLLDLLILFLSLGSSSFVPLLGRGILLLPLLWSLLQSLSLFLLLLHLSLLLPLLPLLLLLVIRVLLPLQLLRLHLLLLLLQFLVGPP